MNGSAVSDLINGAFRSFGYLGQGAALTAADSYNAFEALNDLVDEANNDRLMIWEIARNVFPLTPGTMTYTLGTGGTFNTPRPPKIDRISVLLTMNNPAQEIPINVLDDEEWQNVTIKTGFQSAFPVMCYPDNNFPLNNLSFWPTPSAQCSCVIYAWSVIAAFTGLSQIVAFPPGYKNFLRYGLAIRMAPEYGFEASPTIHKLYADARMMIKSVNWRMGRVQIDEMLHGNPATLRAIKSQGLVVD